MGSNPHPLPFYIVAAQRNCGGFAELHYTCADANKRLGEAVGVVEVDQRRGFFVRVLDLLNLPLGLVVDDKGGAATDRVVK